MIVSVNKEIRAFSDEPLITIQVKERDARKLVSALVYGAESLQKKSASYDDTRNLFYENMSIDLSNLHESIEKVLK